MTKIDELKTYLKEQIAEETNSDTIKRVGDLINGVDELVKEQDELMKRYTSLHENYVKQIMSTPTEQKNPVDKTLEPFNEDKELENILDNLAIDLNGGK